jgi:TolB-like protein
MTFFGELQRRNVVRVGIAYAAFAWLLFQIVETVLPLFGMSDDTIRVIFIILVIGFVPALIFAWAFEMTPEGLKRESEVDRSASITPHTGKKLDRLIMVVLGLALTYFIVDKFVLDPARDAAEIEVVRAEAMEQGRTEALQSGAPDNSIAVLPFLNMSREPDNEYFSDGVSEELLNLLAQAGGLVVASRTSSFFFKNKDVDIPQVAERLNVRHVLEGSVRRSGNQVRVTAQLIDARSDSHLWSETFDRELGDIFAVQDEIARSIVGQLRETLGAEMVIGEPEGLSQTENVEAYQLYLRGLSLLRLRGIDNIRRSTELFDEAIALDPGYARAHAQKAVALGLTPFYEDGPRPPWLKRAEASARRAIELDPKLAGPHATLASVHQNMPEVPRQITEAEYRTAIELDPNYVTARQWYGEFLMTVGKARGLLVQLEEAHRLDPLAPVVNTALAWGYLYNGDLQQAERFALTGLELGMGGTWAQDVLGLVYLQQRDYEKTLEIFSGDHPDFTLNREVVEAARNPALRPELVEKIITSKHSRISFWPVELIMMMGEPDRALVWALELAEQGHGDVRSIWRPMFTAHAHKPAFKRLVELYGLPEYWRENGWPDFCRPAGDDFSCSTAFYNEQ